MPFIDFLYKLKLTRRKEGEVRGIKKSLFDKLHDKKAGTPIGGGILVIAVVVILFALLVPLISRLGVKIEASYPPRKELILIFFTFIMFGVLGFLDDYTKIFGRPRPGALGAAFGLSKRTKFGLQWVLGFIVGFLLYSWMGISILHVPLIDVSVDIGAAYVPFAAFIVVFFANAFNFTDGLDGLASGLLIIYLLTYMIMIVTIGNQDTLLYVFTSLWIGALGAFLYFNIWPARIFLGDAGALSFGAMIAVIGLMIGNVATLFIVGGIFVIEAATSAIQIFGWKLLNRPIFPLAPIHHTFLTIGWEEPKIVMRAWIIGILMAIFGLWLAAI
ncbi:MAG: Phospho-N-acetylmuramoyl-pentapeptide-transferase [Candidatus Woesebacteria bacterium GW2011_GWB1_43_14]|uniref:Phospho-N-acetylmuramoyl-pentapeptide-transferase n=1 Tax=Candidatus Woesebacteria bacterium GW2011_GWB1_43_14 TaxID=1618578 RepID=A0A0G1FQ49_9BACT|nr:MAG: Phospho-N-acetylmuramoyl-pentapeptide-transferase [Candidatus Woesebacteria bacterium GW2011_GWA1_39_11b]KKS78438.1 MAG: Phospho-N-acetylmuramoyl-pentapeptide-transferase [Candidatus Woesebacteria bacterium GW2011_GWC1_42_9]KKS97146.1 MAG: Phospho-N-acetylmuramoyl-pentapeptide-transferase [Candidatus Woesebacteria bacterium GW2011_GWB1_43_14]